ncbi:hypothetical protein BDU57DRAFT_361019 [Ampelomyces quisqualis]|uniref:Uncharacterized protein n=1 Tax=Ampelomyces quisqualis TaxID=50730 RepID=A0A6A5QCX3_AMPQU|nr:hypothetical protein BDU57DRAFT_361019 [Ampelomyces quisqualis]
MSVRWTAPMAHRPIVIIHVCYQGRRLRRSPGDGEPGESSWVCSARRRRRVRSRHSTSLAACRALAVPVYICTQYISTCTVLLLGTVVCRYSMVRSGRGAVGEMLDAGVADPESHTLLRA